MPNVNLTLDKNSVGLGNVDNTSDLNKPISTATQTALNLKEDSANKSNSQLDAASTTKFPVWASVVTYVTGLGYLLASTAASTYQTLLNKVTSWQATPDDTHYPSEKLVKDSLNAKQDTLVSATNIKTINSTSLLGSGNITVGTDATFNIYKYNNFS